MLCKVLLQKGKLRSGSYETWEVNTAIAGLEATNKEHIETRAGQELDLMGFKGFSQGLGHKIK
jgi:hypothetical protein